MMSPDQNLPLLASVTCQKSYNTSSCSVCKDKQATSDPPPPHGLHLGGYQFLTWTQTRPYPLVCKTFLRNVELANKQ